MKCVDAVVLRIRTGRVVYAASRNDRHVGALSDKEIVIYGIFEIADRKQYGDMPANLCTPKFMAEECMKLAGSLGLDVTVFDEKAMEKLGMGCLLGVAKGSHQKPRMVVIEYHGGKKEDAPVALVGKGLTFDSGGISFLSTV